MRVPLGNNTPTGAFDRLLPCAAHRYTKQNTHRQPHGVGRQGEGERERKGDQEKREKRRAFHLPIPIVATAAGTLLVVVSILFGGGFARGQRRQRGEDV